MSTYFLLLHILIEKCMTGVTWLYLIGFIYLYLDFGTVYGFSFCSVKYFTLCLDPDSPLSKT